MEAILNIFYTLFNFEFWQWYTDVGFIFILFGFGTSNTLCSLKSCQITGSFLHLYLRQYFQFLLKSSKKVKSRTKEQKTIKR